LLTQGSLKEASAQSKVWNQRTSFAPRRPRLKSWHFQERFFFSWCCRVNWQQGHSAIKL